MDEDEDDFYGGGGMGMQDAKDTIRQQEYISRDERMDESDEEEEDSDDVGCAPHKWLCICIDTAM